MTRTKRIIYNSNNVMPGSAQRVYRNNPKIKQTKIITRDTPKKTVVKTTNYSPINYYGKQTKTRTKVVTRK